jgi:hypothetical protein
LPGYRKNLTNSPYEDWYDFRYTQDMFNRITAIFPLFLSICMMDAKLSIAIVPLKAVFNEQANEIKINWDKIDNNIRQFTLQYSTDDRNWKDLARQTVTDFYNKQVFQFFHRQPARGKNYYRLKITYASLSIGFSSSVLVNAAPVTKQWTIYPVPVGDVLTLEYLGAQKIMGVINVFILGVNGNIITRLRCSSLNKIINIPVGNLGRGIYDIRIIILDEITWSERFVK